MSSFVPLAWITFLAVLGVLCAERPRLGGPVTVALFGSSAAYMACQGAIAATVYCVLYACLFGLCARMSFTLSNSRPTSVEKD